MILSWIMEIPSGWMKNAILNGVSVLMNVIPAYVVSFSDNFYGLLNSHLSVISGELDI